MLRYYIGVDVIMLQNAQLSDLGQTRKKQELMKMSAKKDLKKNN